MKDFQGKTAFVTGAASGIGLAMAQAFLERGMNVMLADVEKAALDRALAGLSKHGNRMAGVLCDVSLEAEFQRAARETFDKFGKVHILCNNAGVSPAGLVEEVPLSDWEWVIGVNLYGMIYGVRTFLPHMKAHGEPSHIVSTSSMSGLTPKAQAGTYGATKFAIVGLSDVLRQECEGTNVGVSVLCPGWTRTNMPDNGRNRPDRYGGKLDYRLDPKLVERNARYVQGAASGLDPLHLAELVVQAIEHNELYIFTQPNRRADVQGRFDEIMRAFDAVDERLPKILQVAKAS
jgi:NAD(P)-dependent dehydrogenase (short-subunit alcohol dehydrogenase family)